MAKKIWQDGLTRSGCLEAVKFKRLHAKGKDLSVKNIFIMIRIRPMKNVTKLAKKSAGLSQRCSICPLMQRCTLEIHRACFDSFVEGFKKGARAVEKEINKKFKSEQI